MCSFCLRLSFVQKLPLFPSSSLSEALLVSWHYCSVFPSHYPSSLAVRKHPLPLVRHELSYFRFCGTCDSVLSLFPSPIHAHHFQQVSTPTSSPSIIFFFQVCIFSSYSLLAINIVAPQRGEFKIVCYPRNKYWNFGFVLIYWMMKTAFFAFNLQLDTGVPAVSTNLDTSSCGICRLQKCPEPSEPGGMLTCAVIFSIYHRVQLTQTLCYVDHVLLFR